MRHYKPEEIGFLIKLAALRFKDTDSIHLSNDEIVNRMHVSKTTFYRLIRALLLDGIVTKTADGYSLSTEIFHIPEGNDKIQSFKAQLDEMAEKNPEFKKDKVYRTFYSHYNTDFRNLKMPKKDFPAALESGLFFRNREPSPIQEQVKEYEF